MSGERLIWFGHGELPLLMALCGGSCTAPIVGGEPDDAELTRTAARLFNRGLLTFRGDRCVPDGDGLMVERMAGAGAVVTVTAGERQVILYVSPGTVWPVEILPEGFRARELAAGELRRWLLDTELLPEPVLSEEDARGLEPPPDETPDSRSYECRMTARRSRNGGGSAAQFRLVVRGGLLELLTDRGAGESAELYTTGALERFMAECFGPPSDGAGPETPFTGEGGTI